MRERLGTNFRCEVTLKRGGKIIERRVDPPEETLESLCKNLINELSKLLQMTGDGNGERN